MGLDKPHPSKLLIDRRREPRVFATCDVLLSWGLESPSIANATVVDWNRLGMRIKHEEPLKRDEIIRVRLRDRVHVARVMWVAEINGTHHESGLLYLADDRHEAHVEV
jgi:hypothetical protein